MILGQPLLLVTLGLLPSLVWLIYYLKKDPRPEPKYMITRTFFLGIIVAPLAVIAQWIFRELAIGIRPDFDFTKSYLFFTWAAFVEETVKFLAVNFVVLHDSEFDEPVDAMIYMIIAALGFAAIENILVLFQAGPSGVVSTLKIWGLRFVGATLLHAVSSAITGYFLALSWFYNRHNKKIILGGLGLATLAHLTFNMILLRSGDGPESFINSTFFIIIVAGLIAVLFSKIKKRAYREPSTINS